MVGGDSMPGEADIGKSLGVRATGTSSQVLDGDRTYKDEEGG